MSTENVVARVWATFTDEQRSGLPADWNALDDATRGAWGARWEALPAEQRELLLGRLSGESIAPDGVAQPDNPRAAILKRGEKEIKGYGLNKRTKRAHNLRTFKTALECVAAGLAVVDVHSIDDDGECTCQWGRQKAIDEGRTPQPPCSEANKGKHPRGGKWQKGATTDPAHILARWSAAKGYLNVGVVFGGDTDVVLIEGDGPEGDETLERWRTENGLPDTVTCISGSGGLHHYYRVPSGWDIRNSVKVIGPGMDVRGEHGFSVTSGSRHESGIAARWKDGEGVYGWLDGHGPDDIAIANAPMWLLRKMWFATVDRRHSTAPDGSKWEDAGLQERESDDGTDGSDGPDPFGNAAKGMGASSGGGWEAKAALIGHGPNHAGNFDDQILRTCNSYFGTFGHEADAAPLKAKLLECIAIAPEDTPRHRDRYLSDDYLDPRIQQARDYVKGKGGEAEKVKGPRDPWPQGYCEDDGRLCYLREKVNRKTGESTMEPVPMCSLFEVVGRTINETREAAYGTRIAFMDEHKRLRATTIKDSEARSDTGGVIATLSELGFWIDNTAEAKQRFLTLLGRLKSDKVVITASRAGWHGSTFITPYGEAIGDDKSMCLAENRRFGGDPTRGTLDGWLDVAADVMTLRDFHATVIISAGFAGVLVDLLKLASCGLAFTRQSSIGKTQTMKFASTIWCNPIADKSLFVVLDATSNGPEVPLADASGTALMLDEMKELDPPERGKIIMKIPNNRSKLRQDGEQNLQDALRWWTYYVTSAEETIEDLIKQARDATYVTGQAVRCVDISVFGVKEADKDLIEALERRQLDNWGWAGPKFVQYLIDEGYAARPERIAKRLDEVSEWLIDGQHVSSTGSRAAGVVAIAMVAAELAQEAGCLPCEARTEAEAASVAAAFGDDPASHWLCP